MFNRFIRFFDKGLVALLRWPAIFAILAMMMVTVVDVFARSFLGEPLKGSIELTQLLLGLMVFAAFPIVVWRQQHICVDLFDNFIPSWFVAWRQFIINAAAVLAMILLAKQFGKLAARAISYGDVTEFLRIPKFYLLYAMMALAWVSAVMSALRALDDLRHGIGHISYKYNPTPYDYQQEAQND